MLHEKEGAGKRSVGDEEGVVDIAACDGGDGEGGGGEGVEKMGVVAAREDIQEDREVTVRMHSGFGAKLVQNRI